MSSRSPRSVLFLCAVCAGAVWYAWHHQWISLTPPWLTPGVMFSAEREKRTAVITYWANEKYTNESKEILCCKDKAKTVYALASAWVLLFEESLPETKKISLQSVSCSENNEYFISFDASLFSKEQSIFTKLMIVESLLKTIRDFEITGSIRLLVHHQPLIDFHLSFERPWPIDGFLAVAEPQKIYQSPITGQCIVIDPSGDIARAGRIIDDYFERALTMHCAQELKDILQKTTGHPVIISRRQSETLTPFELIASVNTIDTKILISLNFYQETEQNPRLFIYYPLVNPTTDFWNKQYAGLQFVAWHQGYLRGLGQSYIYAHHLKEYLKKEFPGYAPRLVTGAPLRYLLGSTKPALIIEAGLRTSDDAQALCEPLSKAIAAITQQK